MAGIHDAGTGKSGKNVLTGDIEAGEKSSRGRIAVDEEGEDMGIVLDNSAKGEEELRYGGQVVKVEAQEWSWHEIELRGESSVSIFSTSVYRSPTLQAASLQL